MLVYQSVTVPILDTLQKKMQIKTSLVNVDNPIFKRLKDKSTHLRLNKW